MPLPEAISVRWAATLHRIADKITARIVLRISDQIGQVRRAWDDKQKMMNSFRVRLLQLIHANNGQLSWYQLDRALSCEGVERQEHLMHALKGLESEGYIATQVGANVSQPSYSMTPDGVAILSTV